VRSRWLYLLLSPVGLLLLSAFRLIIIARFNTTTAITVATSGGYVNTIVGSIIPLIPLLVPYLAIVLLISRYYVLSAIAFAFAIFITPSQLRLPVTEHFARIDESELITRLSSDKLTTFIIAAVIVLAVWALTRSFVEAISALAIAATTAALLYIAVTFPSGLTGHLRSAVVTESRMISFARANPHWALVVLVTFAIIVAFTARAGESWPARVITVLISVAVAIVLFPYIYNFYPLPTHRSYYVNVLETPWLPAEELGLKSGLIYTGYVLSTDDDWFVVLLDTTRRVAYIPASEVAFRTICQPRDASPADLGAPLIRVFYTKPPHVAACPAREATPARMFVVSHGQSLDRISSLLRVPPQQIIATTNAYYHGRESDALRTYEQRGDWAARTPPGQYFWYYPSAIR
jgi:hypothetical protein